MTKKSLLLTIGASMALFAGMAYAGTSGSEFEALYTLVSDWASGFLGRSIALVFLIVGLGVGVVSGSIMAAVTAIAAAVSLLVAPSVISGILTAII